MRMKGSACWLSSPARRHQQALQQQDETVQGDADQRDHENGHEHGRRVHRHLDLQHQVAEPRSDAMNSPTMAPATASTAATFMPEKM
jgi:hypothetical protein